MNYFTRMCASSLNKIKYKTDINLIKSYLVRNLQHGSSLSLLSVLKIVILMLAYELPSAPLKINLPENEGFS